MAFPDTPLNPLLELLVDGAWLPVPTYERDVVDVQAGLRERATVTDPGSLSITINNRDGRFSPRNPLSDLYGKIGRNTRCRLSVPGTESYLELDGSRTGVASTPDDAALDITGDIDLRWEGIADWYAPGAQMLIGKWGEAGQRAYHMRLQDGWIYSLFTTDGTSGAFAGRALPPLPRRAALRVTFDADNGAGGSVIRYYWAETLDGPWTQVGTDAVLVSTITIATTTSPLTIAPYQEGSTPAREPVAGRCYRAEVRSGIGGTVVAAPDFRTQPGGTTEFADSAGRTWTLSGTASIRDRADLFLGEISEWPQEWTPDGADAWVPIQGAGILRRMGQGRKLLQSSLRRRIPAYGPLAYWPMEEGEYATRAYSPIAGVPPLALSLVRWADNDSLVSSEALPTIQNTASDRALMSGLVPAPSDTLTEWGVQWLYRLDQPNTTKYTFMRILCTGTVREWYIQQNDTISTIIAKDSDGNTLLSHDLATGTQLYGEWVKVEFNVVQTGPGTMDWHIGWVFGLGESAVGVTLSMAGTIGRPTAVGSPPGGFGAELTDMAIGHISVWSEQDTTAYDSALNAWTGETAWARMQRLADEENVRLARLPGPETTEAVGYQKVDTLLDQLQTAADADGGLLLEDRIRPGLLYRERSSMYSQEPALVLSYDQAPGLKAPLKPVDDDTAVRNDRTVKRDGGSEARAVLEDGPLSVQDPPDGIGLYDDSVTLSLHADAQAEPIAYWRLHLGTHDGPRYPRVQVMLHKAPNLIPAVLGLTEGDLIRITDLPKWVGYGHVDLLVHGIHHRARLTQWEVELTCSPAQPWQVGKVAVHEDFEDTAYAVTITDGGTLPWTRTNTRSYTGSWSLRSGAITNNQTSDAVVTVPAGMTALTFAYRVSSEASGPGFEGDRLTVLVDGVQVLRAQGTASVWTRTTIDVTDKSTVTFRYAKDNSTAGGEDTAWIDDLVFEGASPMRADTDGSELAAAVDAATTTLSVAVTAGPVWTTTASDFPFDVQVGGEVMRVTAITGATSPQTWTVQRAVNGIVKPHAAGTPVRLANPTTVAL